MKNGTKVTLNLSLNVVNDSNNETNFPHKVLLTDTQVPRIHKAFANGSSANKHFSKTHFSKMIQIGAFFPIFDIVAAPALEGGKMAVKKRAKM